MLTFALITEGITDQVTIESILIGYYDAEPEVRYIQPLRDATDKNRQGNFAGWEMVVEHCSQETLGDLFSLNDYLIIQIDTDICHLLGINMPKEKNNKEEFAKKLIDDVIKFLISKINDDVYNKHKDKIIFAICIHSLECWLLPLHSNEKIVYSKINSCEAQLRLILAKKGIDYQKTHDCYLKISKDYEKRAIIEKKMNQNISLAAFIRTLPE